MASGSTPGPEGLGNNTQSILDGTLALIRSPTPASLGLNPQVAQTASAPTAPHRETHSARAPPAEVSAPAPLPSAITPSQRQTAVPVKPKVGVAIAFFPVQFRKNENPASQDSFYLIEKPEFATPELLADARSRAVIQVQLVKLSDAGKVPGADLAPTNASDGTVVLTLGDGRVGELKFGAQKGATIKIPVKDLSGGLSPRDANTGLVFTTSREIGTTTLKVTIVGNSSYDYIESFTIPKASVFKHELKIGSRSVGSGTKGYDGLKLQWYLRKFGFLSYKEQAVPDEGPRNDWADLKEIVLDGEVGDRSVRALRDFQRVARGAFRNQHQTAVNVTFSASVSTTANRSAIDELLVWYDAGYVVDDFHGLLKVDHRDGTPIKETAHILYGALLHDDDYRGYLEVTATVGQSVCHWGATSFVVADSIHTEIRLFKRNTLEFRLHNADPDNLLDDTHHNPNLIARVTSMLQALRKEQQGQASGSSARDVRVLEGFRSIARQDALYAKGRTAPGEPCKHPGEATRRPVGTCPVHPLGSVVTHAPGSSMSSWHQFGVAMDIGFCAESNGGKTWGDDKDWEHLGDVGKGAALTWGGDWTGDKADPPHFQVATQASPGQTHKDTYNNTAGSDLDKLAAVWALL
jgi:hypothetical protein